MLRRFARMPPRQLGVSALLLGEGFGRTVAAGQVRLRAADPRMAPGSCGGPTDGAGFLLGGGVMRHLPTGGAGRGIDSCGGCRARSDRPCRVAVLLLSRDDRGHGCPRHTCGHGRG